MRSRRGLQGIVVIMYDRRELASEVLAAANRDSNAPHDPSGDW